MKSETKILLSAHALAAIIALATSMMQTKKIIKTVVKSNILATSLAVLGMIGYVGSSSIIIGMLKKKN